MSEPGLPCWQCKTPTTFVGYIRWMETQAVEEVRYTEDDAEYVVVDRPVEMVIWCFRCPACNFGFTTDIAGIGLGTEASDYPRGFERAKGFSSI